MGAGGWLLSALLPAIGAVAAWWVRDHPLPFEQDRLNPFSPTFRRRFYGVAAALFAVGAVACVAGAVSTAAG